MTSPTTPRIRAWFDGACEPVNPGGHASWGALVEVDGAVVFEKHGYVGYGRGMTNHVAEYCGCIAVLEEIAKHEGDAIVLGDSAMVINQMKGQWNATKGDYLPYYEQAKAHLGVIGEGRVSFQFIPRAENARADALSNKALSERGIHPTTRKKFKNGGKSENNRLKEQTEPIRLNSELRCEHQ